MPVTEMYTAGYGDRQPLVTPERTASDRAKNRHIGKWRALGVPPQIGATGHGLCGPSAVPDDSANSEEPKRNRGSHWAR